ncbi:hypothetical protein Tco_1377789 [Tanacetum coccineum]
MLRTSMVDFRGNWNTHFREMSFSLRWGLSFEYGCASFEAWYGKELLMPRVVKSQDEIFLRWGYCDNRGLSRLDNQSIERDRLIGIGFVLDFVEFISFTFGDKEMILVIEAVRTSIWRDVRTLAIEEAYTTKYSIHPGADTMLCGFRLTNRWLSMKKDIASCGSKYLAYLEVEVEYQGSSGLLLQPELPE